MKIEVMALREFYYDKVMVQPGKCEIDEKDLKVLVLAKAVEELPQEKSKRRYHRRDMTAEKS